MAETNHPLAAQAAAHIVQQQNSKLSIPSPLHHFEFDAIGATPFSIPGSAAHPAQPSTSGAGAAAAALPALARINDLAGAVQLAVDRLVPVQGATGPAIAWGKAGALLVTWPVKHGLPNQPKQPALPDLAPPWTLALWLRRDAATGGSSLLSSRKVAIKLEQWATDGQIGITRFDVCDWHCAVSVPLGRWCHLALVASSDRTDVYLDGESVGSIGASIELPRGWIGSSAGWTEFCEASMAQMQMFDVALDPAMVQQLARTPVLACGQLSVVDGWQRAVDEPAALDFGTVTDNCLASLQVVLHNTGSTPVLLTPQLRELPDPADLAASVSLATTPATPATSASALAKRGKPVRSAQFALELPGSRVLPPGASTRLICHFMARYLGTSRAELVIESNDERWPKRTIGLQASGDVPIPLPLMQVALADTPLADGQTRWLGQVAHGTRKVWLLSLANRGSAPLELRLRLVGSRQFSCWQGAGPHTVLPGGVFCADLAFVAENLDDARTSLTIFSNDPNQGEFRCKLQAAGSAAGASLQVDGTDLTEAAPLEMGQIPIGQSLRHVIRLKNTGQSVALLAEPPRLVNSRCKSFRLDVPALTVLPPGATLALPITFTAKSAGPKRARVKLALGRQIAELQLVAHAADAG